MNGYICTPLVGGVNGTKFDDLQEIGELRGQIPLDVSHPINRIEVSHGWIVDGLKIYYQRLLLGGESPKDSLVTVCQHGTEKRDASVIDLKSTEIIKSVFGRAGYQKHYQRDMINSIGFVIFDDRTCTTRVAGPFGNENGSSDGEPFHVANIVAFGGYARPAAECGLAGLKFYKDVTLA